MVTSTPTDAGQDLVYEFAERLERLDHEEQARLRRKVQLAELGVYARDLLTGPAGPPAHGRFIVARHHRSWSNLANTYKLLCVQAARDSGKSFMFTKAAPLWLAEKFPNEHIAVFSDTERQAFKKLKYIKDEVETNNRLNHLNPFVNKTKNRVWSASEIILANGTTISAHGYGTKTRGLHPKAVIIDDPLGDNAATSPLVRKQDEDYFFGTIRPMIPADGLLWVIGTPQHRNDLLAVIEATGKYICRKYPALHPTTNAPLWASRYSAARLQAILEEIKAAKFAREYLLRPDAAVASLFPPDLIEADDILLHSVRLGESREFWVKRGFTTFILGVDFGLSANTNRDYTVITVLAIDDSGTRAIAEIFRANALSYYEQKNAIFMVANKYRADTVWVEGVAAQKIFGETLAAESDLPVEQFYTSEEKHSALKGIPALRNQFERKKFLLPADFEDDHTRETIRELLGELGAITMSETGRVISVAKHDDMVLSLYIADRAAVDAGYTFRFGFEPTQEHAIALADLHARMGMPAPKTLGRHDLPAMDDGGQVISFPKEVLAAVAPGAAPAEIMRTFASTGLTFRDGVFWTPEGQRLIIGAGGTLLDERGVPSRYQVNASNDYNPLGSLMAGFTGSGFGM